MDPIHNRSVTLNPTKDISSRKKVKSFLDSLMASYLNLDLEC